MFQEKTNKQTIKLKKKGKFFNKTMAESIMKLGDERFRLIKGILINRDKGYWSFIGTIVGYCLFN